MICKRCGEKLYEEQTICIKCGTKVEVYEYNGKRNTNNFEGKRTINEDNKWLVVILCLFLGSLGVHNFYLGEMKRGIRKILLSLICLSPLMALIDLVKILSGNYVCKYD